MTKYWTIQLELLFTDDWRPFPPLAWLHLTTVLVVSSSALILKWEDPNLTLEWLKKPHFTANFIHQCAYTESRCINEHGINDFEPMLVKCWRNFYNADPSLNQYSFIELSLLGIWVYFVITSWTQQAQDVESKLIWRSCNVVDGGPPVNLIESTSCACWEGSIFRETQQTQTCIHTILLWCWPIFCIAGPTAATSPVCWVLTEFAHAWNTENNIFILSIY